MEKRQLRAEESLTEIICKALIILSSPIQELQQKRTAHSILNKTITTLYQITIITITLKKLHKWLANLVMLQEQAMPVQ
jgi:hypothetical protein